MKTQTLTIDGAMYTRVAKVYVTDKGEKRAFKQKGVCQIGTLYHAEQAVEEISKTGREAQLVLLSWYWHPSLRDPVLSEAVFPNSARIFLVRVK